jgi:hypothetical protein
MTEDKRTLAVPEETAVPTTGQFDVVVDADLDEPEVRDHHDDSVDEGLDDATREKFGDLYRDYEEVRESGSAAERVDVLERIVEQLTVLTTGQTVEQLKN